jgi:hypothetical protein
MSIREGSGETTVAMAPAAAFAYLADPRHAPGWFAGVSFAEPPEGPPREGMTWRFVRSRGQVGGKRGMTPVWMAAYAPPARFVWRTRYHWPRTNLAWELRCDPANEAEPGESGRAQDTPTRLTFTMRIEPGPLGWLTLLVATPFSRDTLARRAQRAVERAREALLQQTTGGARRAARGASGGRRAKPTRKGRTSGKRHGEDGRRRRSDGAER